MFECKFTYYARTYPICWFSEIRTLHQDYYDDEGDSELLSATGALQQSVIDEEDGNKYVLSKLGRKLLKYGLRIEVSDLQPRGTKVTSPDLNKPV